MNIKRDLWLKCQAILRQLHLSYLKLTCLAIWLLVHRILWWYCFPEDVARLFFSKTMSKTTTFEKLVVYIFFDLPVSIQSTKSQILLDFLSGKLSWKPYKSSFSLLALFITLTGRAVYLDKNVSKMYFLKKCSLEVRKIGWSLSVLTSLFPPSKHFLLEIILKSDSLTLKLY